MPISNIDYSNTSIETFTTLFNQVNATITALNLVIANTNIAANSIINTALGTKAANSYVNAQVASLLASRAANSYVVSEIASLLASRAANSFVNSQIASLLASRAANSYVNTQLGTKAANSYVNAQLATKLDKTGGTGAALTLVNSSAPNLTISTSITSGTHAATKNYVDSRLGGYFLGNATAGDATNGPKGMFRINDIILTVNTTITAGYNASVAGPITIANGTVLTVANTSTLVVV